MREIGKFVKIAYFFFGKAQLRSFNGKLSLELDAFFHFSFIKKSIKKNSADKFSISAKSIVGKKS